VTGPRLSVTSIGDVHLAALLDSTDCPLCAVRADAARRYIASILWESVNDVGFRARLASGRGFCRTHARQILADARAAGSGTLGAAILLSAALRARLEEVARLPLGRGARARGAERAIGLAAVAPDCPVCEHVAVGQRIAVDSLIDHLDDPDWRSRVASARFCLDDLLELWSTAVRSRQPWWDEVAGAQRARLHDVADRLDAFAHHSSFDRRHLMTDAERASADDAALILGGSGADRAT
jgi:hypothetical protein